MSDTSQKRVSETLRELVRGGGIDFAGTILELAIAFVGQLIIARYLSVASFGSLSLSVKLLTFASVFGALGMGPGIIRFVPRYSDPEDQRGVFVSGYQIIIIASVAIMTFIIAFADDIALRVFNNPDAAMLFRILAVAIPANVLLRSAGSIKALGYIGPEVVTKSIIWPVLRITLIVIVAILGGNVAHVAGAYTISYWLAGLVAVGVIVYYTPLLDFSTHWNKKYWSLLKFSIPLSVSGAMGFILSSIDVFMIGGFLSASAVGIYTVAYTLGKTMNLPLGSLNSLFLPLFSEIEAEGSRAELQEIYISITKWSAFLSHPMLMTVLIFAPSLITYTFGEKYVSGSLALQVIALSFFFQALLGPNRKGLEAIGRSDLIMWIDIFAAFLNVALNYFLIPRGGILGAAVATFSTWTLLNALYSVSLYYEKGIYPFSISIYKPMIGYTIILLAVGRTANIVYPNSIASILMFIILGGTVYPAIIAYLGGIEQKDIMIVNSIEERLGVDSEPIKKQVRKFM